MKEQNFFQKHKQIVYWGIFILYAIINFILTMLHEPWRDEIHAWLMSKELSVVNLFIESKFDGHPILWHLLLMPFAKLNFPIITLNIISYIILLVSAWLFLFKTKLPLALKIFAIFTIPFTYTYSAIARNYSCIILLLTIIGIYYPKRTEKPIVYSILICLLIHTHSLAWGIVAGLTITFHFYEIILYLKNKQNNIKPIIIGLLLIIINTLIVIFELYGTTNINYTAGFSSHIIHIAGCIALLLFALLLYTIFVLKSHYKEFIILSIGLLFQIYIYMTVYSSILFQRYILFFALALFYLMLISDTDCFDDIKHFILYFAFIFITIFTSLLWFLRTTINDVLYPYTFAKQMADYINNNVPKNTTILIDASIIGQSIIPYLDKSYSLYDISYNEYVDCANVAYDTEKIEKALSNLDAYRGKYLIICNNFRELNNCKLLYNSPGIPSVSDVVTEYFSLYFIPNE